MYSNNAEKGTFLVDSVLTIIDISCNVQLYGNFESELPLKHPAKVIFNKYRKPYFSWTKFLWYYWHDTFKLILISEINK